ncbi:MAG: NHL repeat-containing protein [Candidatus Acidiferrales bacterium]
MRLTFLRLCLRLTNHIVVAIAIIPILFIVSSCGRPPQAAQSISAPPLQFLGQWGRTGTEPGEFQNPQALACDAVGNVYIADDGNPAQIEKFDSLGHPLLVFAAAGNQNDWDIAIDAGGAIFVVDRRRAQVQIFSPEGESFRTLFFRYRRDFHDPASLAIDPTGDFYLADSTAGRVVRVSPRGRTLEGWGKPAGLGAGRWMPYPIRLAQDGNLYVADAAAQRIERLTSVGRYVTSWEFPFSGMKLATNAAKSNGLAVSGNFVVASDEQKRLLEIWTLEGVPKLTVDFSQHPEWGEHASPTDVAFAPHGELLVLDGPDSRVLRFKVNIKP